jgi:hypothetical protein
MHSVARPIMYLAGGFRSGWQRKVCERLGEIYLILDPSAHGILDRCEYTKWDLDAIRKCDVVLAYMESSNPAGYSLTLEVGFAHALGKVIIFVDEVDPDRTRFFDMVHAIASRVYSSLDDALEALLQPGNFNRPALFERRTIG